MQLDLVLNFSDEAGQEIAKGSIIKWHKAEGNPVAFGDDLFDMKVEQVWISEAQKQVLIETRKLDLHPTEIAQIESRQRPEHSGTSESDSNRREPIDWLFFLRVTAIESGILSHICAPRECRQGDVLAVFTRAVGGSVGELRSPFRCVANVVTPGLEHLPSIATQTKTGKFQEEYSGENFLMFRSEPSHERRIGIYMRGSCDLNMIFACKPLIPPVLRGTCCIVHDGSVADSRSDLLLQTLKGLPQNWIYDLTDKIRISPDYLAPKLFENTFTIDGPNGPEVFQKHVIVLSIGADVSRTVYRHRERCLLIDPGGGWLNEPIANFLSDLSAVAWFRKNFESIGKLSIDRFIDNFTKILDLIKSSSAAHVLVFNMLTTEPNSQTHNYQFVKNPDGIRRLEFNLALTEMSRKYDFSIIDVDGILKRIGIRTQLDWNHAHPKVNLLIAQEAFRMMKDLAIFDG